MDPLLAAAAWFILWWLCFFVMLPIGVRSAEEEGQAVTPGHDTGAPSRPNLAKKALWAAGLATGLWIALIFTLNAVYYNR